jgi:hypothetical protein
LRSPDDQVVLDSGAGRGTFTSVVLQVRFGPLMPGTRLLAMTVSLAVEVHTLAGDVAGF